MSDREALLRIGRIFNSTKDARARRACVVWCLAFMQPPEERKKEPMIEVVHVHSGQSVWVPKRLFA